MTTTPKDLHDVAAEVARLREAIEGAGRSELSSTSVHPRHRDGASNLAAYLELRRHDARGLQGRLAGLGLSSFGRIEPHVLETIHAVEDALSQMGDRGPVPAGVWTGPDDAAAGAVGPLPRSDAECVNLLGAATGGRRTRIMVTLPESSAQSSELVDAIIDRGVEVVRINCAHDGPDAWLSMIENVRRAGRRVGRQVTVVMDLAGPKLRTGPIGPGAPVVKVKPSRSVDGHVVQPGLIWLSTITTASAVPDGAVSIPVVDAAWVAGLVVGERIMLHDARESARVLTVVDRRAEGVLVETRRTCYFVPGIELEAGDGAVAEVGMLPRPAGRLRLRVGDTVDIVRDLAPVSPDTGPARIGCSLPQVFDDVRVGHRVYFDDGRIGGVAESATADVVRVRVTEAGPTGARLRAGKGINLPDTTLRLPALTDEDRAHLPFVAAHADVVSLSFVRQASDVRLLQVNLDRLGAHDLGILLKIETVAGFENLPAILATALVSPSVGVMIARGDLAVEAGYERLAEVQEEILWLCEAAHVPVIWATQVLDTLARTGRPSRAEVTDAAMSGRAECVMLNKGPYVVEAVSLLSDILCRMEAHQSKRSSLLRRLHAWDSAFSLPDAEPTARDASVTDTR